MLYEMKKQTTIRVDEDLKNQMKEVKGSLNNNEFIAMLLDFFLNKK
jgi:hypothetical protein